MKPRIGLHDLGPPYNGRSPTGAPRVTLGEPTWGPAGFLRDLELRLGLPPVLATASARLQAWVARIKACDDDSAFYRASFLVDELGTAEALLGWRDALVDGGWDGQRVANGGPRLDAMATIESTTSDPMPIGVPDRLVRVGRALEHAPAGLYDTIVLLDARDLWSSRWQHVFAQLEANGTTMTTFVPSFEGAAPSTDLAVLQACLRDRTVGRAVRGDGTVLLVEGDTSAEVAEITAAMLAHGRAKNTEDVVVRCRDPEALEIALLRHGIPGQGITSQSLWRPATQILPLALELTFEPKDPCRALELLTLPVGPFRGAFGARLAKAIAREPGIGGREWELQKAKATEVQHAAELRRAQEEGASAEDAARRADSRVADLRRRVATWLEEPGADPQAAPRAVLVSVVARVLEWLRKRMSEGSRDVYGSAYGQARELDEALARDPRESFSLEETRQMLDRFARGETATNAFLESAGRVAHVSHPSAILGCADRVFVWNFASGVERRPTRLPWNQEELQALSCSNVSLVDPFALLRNEAEQWRRTILAARTAAVFVLPRSHKGVATSLHSLWDEVHARLGLDDRSTARVRLDAHSVLEGSAPPFHLVAPRSPLPLPEPRAAWAIPPISGAAKDDERPTTVSALDTFVHCPLRWVFEHEARLHSGAMTTIASDRLLYGKLSHRLVEVLHGEDAFALDEAPFLTRVAVQLEGLLRKEGAVLLLPGAAIERQQFERRVSAAMRALHRYLRGSGYTIAGIEEIVGTASAIGRLEGRLDVRLRDRDGRDAVLDLKWGASGYRASLKEGRAIQLAVYARALASAEKTDARVPGGYFSLSTGVVLTTDSRMKSDVCIEGPSLDETWELVERTSQLVRESLERGTAYVSGTKRALPLLEALGVPEEQRSTLFAGGRDAPCGYCDYGALCGKRWEVFG